MKKSHLIVLLLLVGILLAACGEASEPQVTTEPTEVTEDPTVDIGGTRLDVSTTELDLSAAAYEMDALIAASDRLTAVTQIELGETELRYEQIEALQEAFPSAAIRYSVSLFGQALAQDTKQLDLSDMDAAQTAELLDVLPLLSALEEINFVDANGVCVYDLETISELDKIRAANPDIQLHVSFELFGQTVTSEDTRIEYYLVEIGNEGAETVRAVLPYLTACEYLLMDGCGVDNEIMAQLREDFPETKVVWRVWLTKPNYDSARQLRCASFLTDTHRIRTVVVTDATCDVLKYCVETKYVDFGHNEYISDFSFLSYMPQLEVAIIGLTNCNDITPLLNCPNLEYLEVYGSKVTDLSPLASCTQLKHLNISRMEVDDITCLYNLELERFRAVDTDVPKEQIEEYARLHPDCQMLMEGWAPHQNGWRYDENNNMVPRYALLREQLEYDLDAQYGIY